MNCFNSKVKGHSYMYIYVIQRTNVEVKGKIQVCCRCLFITFILQLEVSPTHTKKKNRGDRDGGISGNLKAFICALETLANVPRTAVFYCKDTKLNLFVSSPNKITTKL